MKKIIFLAIIFLNLVIINSCDKQVINKIDNNPIKNEISQNNSLLHVANDSILMQVAKKVNNMDSVEYVLWKKENDIKTTMYDIYHKAICENEAINNEIENMSEKEYWTKKELNDTLEFSDYTKQMARKGYLNIIYNDSMAVVKMPTWAVSYAKVLSPEGKVIVGNNLYQYTKDDLIIKDIITGKILKNNVKYYDVYWYPTPPREFIIPCSNTKHYKIIIETIFVQYRTSGDNYKSIYKVDLSFYKQVYRWGRWRHWTDKNTSWSVNGYYNREFTTSHGDHIFQRENIVNYGSRDNYFEPVWESFGGNLNDYIHVERISQNSYTVRTSKGTRIVSHDYPSDRLK